VDDAEKQVAVVVCGRHGSGLPLRARLPHPFAQRSETSPSQR
jgi:hypothetical protein